MTFKNEMTSNALWSQTHQKKRSRLSQRRKEHKFLQFLIPHIPENRLLWTGERVIIVPLDWFPLLSPAIKTRWLDKTRTLDLMNQNARRDKNKKKSKSHGKLQINNGNAAKPPQINRGFYHENSYTGRSNSSFQISRNPKTLKPLSVVKSTQPLIAWSCRRCTKAYKEVRNLEKNSRRMITCSPLNSNKS